MGSPYIVYKYSIVKYVGNKLFEGLYGKIILSLKPTTCRKASWRNLIVITIGFHKNIESAYAYRIVYFYIFSLYDTNT